MNDLQEAHDKEMADFKAQCARHDADRCRPTLVDDHFADLCSVSNDAGHQHASIKATQVRGTANQFNWYTRNTDCNAREEKLGDIDDEKIEIVR